MKKYGISALVGLLVLAGCGGSSSDGKDKAKASKVCGDLSVYEPVKTDDITIEYFGWIGTEEEADMNYCLLQHFQAKYPNVTVKTTIPQNYDEEIESRAAAGKLPDVFPIFNIPTNVVKGYIEDITSEFNKDADSKLINQSIADSMKINGKVYTVPSALQFMGLIQNADLVESVNLSPLSYGYSMEDLEKVLAATTTDKTKGVNNLDIAKWYTMTVDEKQGFYTFNGERFDFSSDEFADGMNKAITFASKGYVGAKNVMGSDNFNAFFGLNDDDDANIPWRDGRIALNYDGTWADMANVDYSADFIGLPEGRVVLVADYFAVGKGTKNKDMAFKLAQFMGYGLEGVKARLAIDEATKELDRKVPFQGIPLIDDADVIKKYKALKEDFPNMLAAYEAFVENPSIGAVEGLKEVPGFNQAVYIGTGFGACTTLNGEKSEDCKAQDIFDGIRRGELKLSDYADRLTTLANEAHTKALEEIKNK